MIQKEKTAKTDPAADIPTILVVFGATGDLSSKKIIPSLWYLYCHNRIPERLAVIGFSRRDITDADFAEMARGFIERKGLVAGREDDLAGFLRIFAYVRGTFGDTSSFGSLAEHIKKIEDGWGVCANKLYYLATPPAEYEDIFRNLAEEKLNLPCGGELGWSRVLVEKPFGYDLHSASELQKLISAYFREEQIYRIDHYLFKEIVQGIENFRFSNNLFEHTWDQTAIERINIRFLESIGVEERGGFYDPVGALRDVGQNHMLIMLAAIAMEYPAKTDAGSAHRNRADILSSLRPWTEDGVKENTFRAQYRGYGKIAGVRQNSDTETYFALETELLHPRWRGIPIYMEAGKRMREARKEIVLTLKHPKVCHLCDAGPHAPNSIVFRLEPDDEIVIHFWAKKPGFEKVLEERTLSFFLYEKETKVQYVEEYAKVLHAAMEGNRALFISPEEVEVSWKFTDPVTDGWRKELVPLAEYDPHTNPTANIFLPEKDGKLSGEGRSAGTIGMVGLGKMGANLARRLSSKNWKVLGFDADISLAKKLEAEGIAGVSSLPEMVEQLVPPRTVWLMVPHQAVAGVLEEIMPHLSRGDTIIDGSNSFYKDSVQRGKELAVRGINFLDAGVSGGPGGALSGACLMIGGERKIYEKYARLFRDLAREDGFAYMGDTGSGHFVKMVHNGIEYGMMQSIAEGFAVMKRSDFSLDMRRIAELYNRGSVIESRLIEWLASAFADFGEDLESSECCSGEVGSSGEGEWTAKAARELGVPVKVIEAAVDFRRRSKGNPSYAGRILSALRYKFGGHDARTKK